MFNSMLNYTSPTAHLEQRRGVVDGGSVVARNRVMNASLWSIVPPSVSAGCGGIDMFAGSFSFISGAQFQQLMRSIAANAPGYAFEAMCPSCMQTMESLQRKLQALSSGMVNSCQLAKGFVNDVADAFDVAHKDKTSLIADTQRSPICCGAAAPMMQPAPGPWTATMWCCATGVTPAAKISVWRRPRSRIRR